MVTVHLYLLNLIYCSENLNNSFNFVVLICRFNWMPVIDYKMTDNWLHGYSLSSCMTLPWLYLRNIFSQKYITKTSVNENQRNHATNISVFWQKPFVYIHKHFHIGKNYNGIFWQLCCWPAISYEISYSYQLTSDPNLNL